MSTLSVTNIKNRLSNSNAIQIDANNNVTFLADMNIVGGVTIGDIDISNSLTVGGNVTLGNALTDNVTLAGNLSYAGTLTGSANILNIGAGQIYKATNGNVGIGTTTPTARLEVRGGDSVVTNADGSVTYLNLPTSGVSVVGSFRTGGSRLEFQTNGVGESTSSTRLILDSAGNAGFGVTPSAANLRLLQGNDGFTVGSQGSSLNLTANAAFNGEWIYSTTASASRYAQSNSSHIWFTAPSGAAGAPITFTQAMTLTNVGRLGLGTDTPQALLDVRGSQFFNTTLTLPALSTALINGEIRGGSGGNSAADNGHLRLSAGGGTTLGTRVGVDLFRNSDGGSGIIAYTQGTERLRITTAGNLLVGNTSAAERLAVQNENSTIYTPTGSAFTPATTASLLNRPVSQNVIAGLNFVAGSENATTYIGCTNPTNAQAAGTMVFGRRTGAASYSESARITSTGYFKASNTGTYGGVAGFGDLSPGTQHVFQSNTATSSVIAINDNTGAATNNFLSNLATGATGNHFRATVNNGPDVYRVLANGNVENTNNSYGAISDAKLKENVTDTTPKLDKLNDVRIVNYNLISNPELKQIGVIAQELEEIFPGLVESTPDTEQVTKTRTVEVHEQLNEEGEVTVPASSYEEEYTETVDLGTVTKSVKYSVFVPILIKALQEETAARKSLEDRLAALEAKLGA